ncbi:hypothetical protein LXL04_033583 [Taraxacum kok-saghyz]
MVRYATDFHGGSPLLEIKGEVVQVVQVVTISYKWRFKEEIKIIKSEVNLEDRNNGTSKKLIVHCYRIRLPGKGSPVPQRENDLAKDDAVVENEHRPGMTPLSRALCPFHQENTIYIHAITHFFSIPFLLLSNMEQNQNSSKQNQNTPPPNQQNTPIGPFSRLLRDGMMHSPMIPNQPQFSQNQSPPINFHQIQQNF